MTFSASLASSSSHVSVLQEETMRDLLLPKDLTRWHFAAAGVIAQMQPKFLANRDLYEAREKSAKMYTWQAVSFYRLFRSQSKY